MRSENKRGRKLAGSTVFALAFIHDLGQIVGTAEGGGGGVHAGVILTPTSLLPEPGAILPLVFGLMMLGRRGLRRCGA